jgi:hypothetical protein
MQAAGHNPSFAKRMGIPQRVAREFNQADKGTKLLARANQKAGKRGGRGRGQRN